MAKLPAGPWEWRMVAGRYVLWSAVGSREVVLDADIKIQRGGPDCDIPVIRVRDDTSRLVDITPDHPVARAIAALPMLLEYAAAVAPSTQLEKAVMAFSESLEEKKAFIPTRCEHTGCSMPAKYRLASPFKIRLCCGEHILYALEDAGDGCVVTKYIGG